MYRYLITLTLLLVWGTSAWISITAFLLIFPNSEVPILFLGIGLEASKVILIFYLHRNWQGYKILQRSFFVLVIGALILLTSSEMVGFLTQSHSNRSMELQVMNTSIDAAEQKERVIRDRIDTIDRILLGLPETFVSKRLREKEKLGYSQLQERLEELIESKRVVKERQISNTAFSAPIYATAKLFDIDSAKVAKTFIFYLVIVLESLGVGLAISVSSIWLPVRKDNYQVVTNVTNKSKALNNQDFTDEIKEIKRVSDPVAEAIVQLVDEYGEFSGTMTGLLELLNADGVVDRNGWPEDANSLGVQLKRLEPQLSEQGIYVKRSRTMERRKVEIGYRDDSV